MIFLFLFSYGLLNRSIEKWFSRPVEDVQYRTNVIASLLTEYAATNAQVEAQRIAATPDAQKSFQTGNFTSLMDEFRRSEITLQGGFAFAIVDDRAEGKLPCSRGLAAAAAQPAPEPRLPGAGKIVRDPRAKPMSWAEPTLATNGQILVAMPLPANYSATLRDIETQPGAISRSARCSDVVCAAPIWAFCCC